jgi:hypothetical protein
MRVSASLRRSAIDVTAQTKQFKCPNWALPTLPPSSVVCARSLPSHKQTAGGEKLNLKTDVHAFIHPQICDVTAGLGTHTIVIYLRLGAHNCGAAEFSRTEM